MDPSYTLLCFDQEIKRVCVTLLTLVHYFMGTLFFCLSLVKYSEKYFLGICIR